MTISEFYHNGYDDYHAGVYDNTHAPGTAAFEDYEAGYGFASNEEPPVLDYDEGYYYSGSGEYSEDNSYIDYLNR